MNRRRELVAWIALCAATVLSRVLVAPGVLYDWDAANYAHAMRDFDVAMHQPHPPGYLLYVLLLRALSVLPGEVTPFIALNALFSCAVLWLLAELARRHATAGLGYLCALAFAVCPPFWHQGAATTIYVTECLCSVLAARAAFALCDGRISGERAALWFGLVVALRPSGALTLGPLMLTALYLARLPLRALLRGVGLFVATVLLWLVPTVLLSGGLERYRRASSALGHWQLDLGSAFGHASLAEVLPRLRRLLLFLLDATNLLLLLALASGVVLLVTWLRRRRQAQPSAAPAAAAAEDAPSSSSRRDALLVLAWLLPPATIYGLHHLPKSGYVLTIVPALYMLCAWLCQHAIWPRGDSTARPRRALRVVSAALLALFLLLNGYGFVAAVPHELLVHHDARIALPSRVLLSGDYGVYALRYRTYAQRSMRRVLAKIKRDDVVVFLMGAHELHRLASYACPDCWLVASSIDHGCYTCNQAACGKRLDFGAFQNRVLRRPHRRTWALETKISAGKDGLYLERARRTLFIGARGAKRVVVVTACPPCGVSLGEGVKDLGALHIGAGFRARALRIVAP
ncbi:MAG: DUF2723 domain-containing protein [Myxococcales bacterium]|nr:DUF2723 domain-containing protein [Myxococcales bacterium]